MNKRKHLLQGQLTESPTINSRTFGFAEHRILSIDKSNRTVRAVVSTAALDSYGESVLPSAFMNRLPDRFSKNAPLIAGHIYHGSDGSLGKIGEWQSMQVEEVPGIGEALVGEAKFFSGTRLADECWTIVEQSSSIAFSVGWITHAVEMREMEVEGVTRKVRVYTDVELLEVSLVTVPANPEAVVQSSLAAQRVSLDASQTPDTDAIQQLQAQVDRLVDLVESLKTELDPEPGSLLHELVMSTIRSMHGVRAQGQGCDHGHDPPERSMADEMLDLLGDDAD